MTHDERAREAERLMALLDGQGDALVIDETGELTPAPVEDEPLDCLLCFTALDEEIVVLDDGAHLCPDCVPEYQALMQLHVVCPICHSKRLLFWGPRRPGAEKYSWRPCEMCHERRWVDGVIARWKCDPL